MESCHRILEDECFKSNEFQNYREAYGIVKNFINFYNNRRLHSCLRYITLNEFYHLYSQESLTNIEVSV
ncbi:IS3 family transposase [Hathewaya limosa]|uniref:IS3 family transposase n=1 Tax=Hathewaya limosa TaxID=1536 RepID=UPI003BF5905B